MTSLEIEAFLTVQSIGSVTKAAELLYISQSSLSTRLRTLEQELGCSLFVRGKGARAMMLTPEGERFCPWRGSIGIWRIRCGRWGRGHRRRRSCASPL